MRLSGQWRNLQMHWSGMEQSGSGSVGPLLSNIGLAVVARAASQKVVVVVTVTAA